MGSQVVVVGARVCDDDGDSRQSDAVLGFSGSKVDDFSSFVGNRGTCTTSGTLSWTKKQDAELHRSNYLGSRSITEDASQGLDHGMSNGSIAVIAGLEGNPAQRRVGKVPRNGSGSFRKQRIFQADCVLPLSKNDDSDKTQGGKPRNNINGKRADRRNSKLPMKAKLDSFSPKSGMSSFNSAAGGSNAFGMYGLKPDVHDVTKLMVDISLDELLDGTYKCPAIGKDKGTRTPSANNNVLVSVRKVWSLICPEGMQKDKQTEESDHAIKKTPSSSSPSSNSLENVSEGDGNTMDELSKCNKDLDSTVKAEAFADLCDGPLYQPREFLEKLVLPPPRDLESLLQDAVKPAVSMKLTDSRLSKQLSHRLNLPPLPWSHNFNGHYKSNNEAQKISNKSTCSGRWVKISSTASFIGGSTKGSVDLESLTYDDSLVPTGQVKYILPEVGKSSTTFPSLLDVSPVACPGKSQPLTALNSPKVLTAAQTLCDMATPSSKQKSNGLLKWPKQSSQKAIKARKSRLDEIPEEDGFSAQKSETVLNHVIKSVEYGSSSKKPKMSLIDRKEDYSHVQAVIGLSSVSAPRSNRPSPSSHSRDFSFVKSSSFRVPPPPRVLDRSNSQNPQKLRKITPVDWNRTRREAS